MGFFNTPNVYKTEYNLIQYDDFTFDIEKIKYCRQSGFELATKNVAKTYDFVKTDKDEINRISISRSKRNLKEICRCNNFTHFVTFTVDKNKADRFSLDEVQDELKKINKAIRRKYKDYRYVFITEKHENGAFHFHGLIKGLSLDEGSFIYNDKGKITIPIYSERLGFDCVKEIDVTDNGYSRLCSYIQKYISKDMVKKYNGQLYFCSKGLKKATRYIIKDVPDTIKWDFDNEFVSIKNFDYTNIADHSDLDYTVITEKKVLDFFNN